MNLKTYLATWEGTQRENKWGRLLQALLIVVVIVQAVLLFTEDSVVVLAPFTLSEEARVMKSDASRSYKEAWGLAFAELLGNVTPATVTFVEERLAPLLSPEIYQEVIDSIEIQAREIRNDRVSLRFEPRFVEYESDAGKVFVCGHSYVRGTSSAARREKRCYEFVIAISRYAPVLEDIDTYTGEPRTAKVLERLGRGEEKRRDNETAH